MNLFCELSCSPNQSQSIDATSVVKFLAVELSPSRVGTSNLAVISLAPTFPGLATTSHHLWHSTTSSRSPTCTKNELLSQLSVQISFTPTTSRLILLRHSSDYELLLTLFMYFLSLSTKLF